QTIAYYHAVAKNIVYDYLNQDEVQHMFSRHARHARLVWGKPKKSQESHEELVALYAIKGNAQTEPPLSGSVVTGASQEYDNLNRAMVSMSMNAKGAKEWEALTGKAYTQDRKSTRLNSSHVKISYAVFCLKKKK